MSLNYLEIERALSEIEPKVVGAEIESVSLVSWKLNFKIHKELADLNLGIKLNLDNESHWLIFSLKQPWCGIFLSSSEFVQVNKALNWAHVFDFSENISDWLIGKKIHSIKTLNQDRIVEVGFDSKLTFKVECFPARPNWILQSETEVISAWRKDKVGTVSEAKGRAVGFVKKPFSVREFEEGSKSSWLLKAQNAYIILRKNFIYDEYFLKIKNHSEEKLAHLIKLKSENMRLFEETKNQTIFKKYGEALLGSMHLIAPKNHSKCELDWGEEKLVIKLDPKLNFQENANKYFAKYKKLKRSSGELEIRKKVIDSELSRFRAFNFELEKYQRKSTDAVDEIAKKLLIFLKDNSVGQISESEKSSPKSSKVDKKIDAAGIKKYLTKEGLVLLIGKNHIENEDLVMRIARGNDLWFHVKGRPGAHAIIQIPKNKTASLESLLDAATAVAHYSGIQNDVKVEVDYTYKKYIKRIAGKRNESGFNVSFSQNKTLSIKVERERLDRLITSYSLR